MMNDLPDVQGKEIVGSFFISRVGVKGIKRPVTIRRPDVVHTLVPTFDISVDLPAHQKGSHMSRHVEVINRSIDMAVSRETGSLEDLVSTIAVELLESHEYAQYADVCLSADYFLEKDSPDRRKVIENYRIFAEAKLRRGSQGPTRSIGVEVSGMSVCPCAMETVRMLIKDEMEMEGVTEEEMRILDRMPAPSHNQRNRTFISLEHHEDLGVEADELIGLVEENLSSPTYEILKRKGEGTVVLNAHKSPKFVEDVLRDVISGILTRYHDLPYDVLLHVRTLSEEAIHKHDAFAERIATLGDLRKNTRFEQK